MPASHTRQWWLAGGIHPSQVVAAYQPKGAVDLAASYVNLANPGTNDATVGVAPTFDSSGWEFDGATQYISIARAHGHNTFAIQFKDVSNSGRLFGNNNLNFLPVSTETTSRLYYNEGLSSVHVPKIITGSLILSGAGIYQSGSKISETFDGVFGRDIAFQIGARNSSGFCACSVSACLISDAILSASQAAALSAAMAAL